MTTLKEALLRIAALERSLESMAGILDAGRVFSVGDPAKLPDPYDESESLCLMCRNSTLVRLGTQEQMITCRFPEIASLVASDDYYQKHRDTGAVTACSRFELEDSDKS